MKARQLLFGAAMAAALAVPAFGQGVEEIVVTAQKRAENVQDVPISINAIGGDALSSRGVRDAGDITKLFPNISAKQSSSINNGITIRGVGTQNFHVTGQQAVGQYVDEISLITPFTSQLGLYDMERVEVLRGPQNTLFGRNTTGGAINYITRKPDVGKEANGYVRVNAGNKERIDVEGAVGSPIGDTLALRAAFQTQNREGMFTNLANGKKVGSIKRYGGRLSLAWEPTPDTDVLLSGHVGYNRGTRTPRKSVGLFAADGVSSCPAIFTGTDQFKGPTNCYAKDRNGALINVSAPKWNQTYDLANPIADVDYEGGLLRIAHDFGGFTLTSISGFDQTKVEYQDPAAGMPFFAFSVNQDAKYKALSQEVRLASSNPDAFKWIVGAYYAHEDDVTGTLVRNNAAGTPPTGVVPSVQLDQKVNIFSLYGQLDYELSNRLNLTGGLRWTSDRKTGLRTARVFAPTNNGLFSGTVLPPDTFIDLDLARSLVANVATPCAPGVVPCNGPTTTVKQKLSEFGGKVGLDFHITDDVMSYASYSRGFKSGSFDVRALAVFNGSGNMPVEPEKLDAYEAGIKSTLLDRQLQLNGAVFYYDWKDLQAFASSTSTGPAFLNVPKTRLYGAELDAKVRLDGGWSIDGSAAYLNTKITDNGGLGAIGQGAILPNSPKWSLNGLLAKETEIGGATLTLQASYRYIGSQQGTLNETPNSHIDAASFVDLLASLTFGAKRQYQVSAWAENIMGTKTCYLMEDLRGFTNANSCVPNEGRALYGLTMQAKF